MRRIFAPVVGWACGVVTFPILALVVYDKVLLLRDVGFVAGFAAVGLIATILILLLPLLLMRKVFPGIFSSRAELACLGASTFIIPTTVVGFFAEGFRFGIYDALVSPEVVPWHVMFAVAGAISADALYQPRAGMNS
ncbi:MAG: hypothetical protein K8R59_15410 [Thermoanaerobaculales bacterium]|nr:hypothetical protein [Thermoanaerobaculales bacterium]